MDDNSVEMKKNLVESLHKLRINADCEVLEIGDMEISPFAYEKTLMLRTREAFLKSIEDQNVLNMPVSTLRRKGSTGSQSGGKRKLSLSSSMFKSFLSNDTELPLRNDVTATASPSTSSAINGTSAQTLHTKINMIDTDNDEFVVPIIKESPPTPRTAKLIDKSAQMMNTAVKMNALIKQNSGNESECRLVVCNLPAPLPLMKQGGRSDALAYIEYLTVLTEDLPRVMLLKGTGSEVVWFYMGVTYGLGHDVSLKVCKLVYKFYVI
jgi:hypothetical protein